MPCDYSKYPADWFTRIRPAILDQASNRCEKCAACNGRLLCRNEANPYITYHAAGPDEAPAPGYRKPIRVVLTIAHLDQDVTNNDPANLAALCQMCHLRHDAQHHGVNAARTRRSRKAAGELFGVAS